MPATLADIQRKYGESVYPLYKEQMHEPYMENPNGIGVQGAVLYDEVEDKVQCSSCGKWFKWINQKHLSKCGFETIDEYKDTYGLNRNTPLCGKSYSELQSKKAVNWNRSHRRNRREARRQAFLSLKVRTSKPNSSVMVKNKFGLCDAQVAARLHIVREVCGREITTKDLNKYDPNLLHFLMRTCRNTKEVFKRYHVVGYGKFGNKMSDTKLIAYLRDFAIKRRRMPTESDFEKYKGPILEFFGSWSRAKMMAGLDQLLKSQGVAE